MTNDYVVLAQIAYDLEDASEELSSLIELMRPGFAGEEIDEFDFNVMFAHLYSHLNTAWNMRNLNSEDLESADSEQLNLWKEFPEDLKPL